MHKLEEGLGVRSYETKTEVRRNSFRLIVAEALLVGSRLRLASRGASTIVDAEEKVPYAREIRLGYHLSHPTPESFGNVQKVLGIHPAFSFVIQVKNPLQKPEE